MAEHDSFGEFVVTIDGDAVRFPLVPDGGEPGRLQDQNLATFQGKVIIGDPSKDDNPVLSSFVRSDLSGGSGVEVLNEGTDLTRFDFGTLYARFAGQITKPLYAENNSAGDVEGTSGNKQVLGQMWDETNQRYVVVWSDGLDVRRAPVYAFPGTGNALDALATPFSAGTLSSTAKAKGVAYQGTHTEERFFLPRGTGYSYITATSLAMTNVAAPDFVGFAVWDNRLVGVDADGAVWWTTLGTAAADWTQYATTVTIPRSRRVRQIVNFFDRGDEPCLFVITDQDIWQLDPDVPDLFRIDYGFPAHPHHGLAATVWNGQLFVSVGMGVMRYTGGSWQPVGLDRDFGLPRTYQGRIVDLVPGYNALYALVQADNGDEELGGRSGVYEFNGSGWQSVWCDDPGVPTGYHTAKTVTGLILTASGDGQTLVLSTAGADDHVYTMPLSLTFANPRAKIAGSQLFGTALQYYLDDGEFDAGMLGYRKIANALQWRVEEPITIPDNANRDTLSWYYRVDRGAWVLLWTGKAAPGRYAAPFGAMTDGVHPGVSFETIQMRAVVDRVTPTYYSDRPMILKHWVTTFQKVLDASYAWQGVVDLSREGGYEGRSNAELRATLEGLVVAQRYYPMTYGGVTYRVFFSQTAGSSAGGHDDRGIRRVNILEIGETLSDEDDA